ncbi:potassium transporter KefB [Fibrella sp. WM1]|uniref:potassium transporter KefB n=1 Tax=Fibrella musci TaxID=3242485 RepID=UPI003522C3B2
MTNANQSPSHPLHPVSARNRMLIGAGIGLLVIAFFVVGVDRPNPAWGKWWMIRPLLVTPAAGAMGGLFYYFMDYLRYQGGAKKVAGIVLGLLGHAVAIWMGVVLGLAGTMWH